MDEAMQTDWKDAMFRVHADAFARIAAARPACATLERVFLPCRGPGGRLAVLDLGCGSGRFLPALSRFSSVVVGLDYSPELLAVAGAARRALPNAILVRGDARALARTFAEGEFDAILRAYTSLGYFARDVERDILRQCARITRPGGRMVIDCYNRAWFEARGRVTRSQTLDEFTFVEEYEWDAARARVACLWRYLKPGAAAVEIPFSLDGYGADAVVELLAQSGWRSPEFLADLATCLPVEDPGTRERIVVVATRSPA